MSDRRERAVEATKEIVKYLDYTVTSANERNHIAKILLAALAAEAQAAKQAAKDSASTLAHDIIYAIRCELEQPSPSMEKIRECLNQWEMRR